jgi:hypothetical protein
MTLTKEEQNEIRNLENTIQRAAYKEESECSQYEKECRLLELKRVNASFIRFLSWVKLV